MHLDAGGKHFLGNAMGRKTYNNGHGLLVHSRVLNSRELAASSKHIDELTIGLTR
jgi:hypothetical protein